jgi:zinc protease
MRFKYWLLVALSLAAMAQTSLLSAQEKLVADRVFHIADPKSTSIQFQMIVLAGSADETNLDQLGIAHYLEHVVLVGRNAGMTDTAQRFFADGNSNGWTSQRMTGYVHRFPSNATDAADRLDRLFRFYSERLTDFAISPEDAVRERNVVRQEHDWRYASNPFSKTWIDASGYLYEGHPFAKSTIGTPETIASFTVDESRAFLKRWYRKNNVYFLVSGPVDASVVKAAADRNLGGLDNAQPSARSWVLQRLQLVPQAREFRQADKRIKTPSFHLQRAVNVPDADAVKTMAVTRLVSNYLGSKLTGSPHSVLTEGDDPVAAAISSASLERSIAGVITLSLGAVPEEGRSLDDVRRAVEAYRAGFTKRGIDAATLERLKARFDRDYRRSLEEPENTPGRLIGWLTSPLPYETMADWPRVIASVTTDDVNALVAALAGPGRDAAISFETKTD